MKRRSLWLAGAAATLFVFHLVLGNALAQQPSAAAVALGRELVEIKGGAGMFDPIIINVIEQTKANLQQTNPQLSKDLTDVSAQLRNEFTPRRNELIAEAGRLYAVAFTEGELKDMTAFYKAPLGKKMLEREPMILDQTFNFMQQWAPRVGEEVMNRFRAEMKKKGHNL